MRILIEEYQYEVPIVRDVLHGIDPLTNIEGKVSIQYVGYYYNDKLRDCVFILPKVLLDEQEKVFGKYKPEEIIDLNNTDVLRPREKDFIYKFAVWIYRAIVVYKNDKSNDTTIVYHANIAQVGKGQRRLSNTYLDILLSLIQFNRDNRNFFFFILKNLHSGYNKINWTRTIGTTAAIIQNNRPVYLNPVNRKRQVNFDEELIIIFFSILNYIGDTYGFTKEIDCHFQLIKGKQFETYLKGYGRMRLLQIKYKYFSDKAIELWRLCYAFFDEARQVYINTEQREYLLVKSFYIVFEAIIDELIGDKPLPDGMEKRQEDGKIVDHLFTARSLIENEEKQTYYIGDSKYYKIGHVLTSESIYKQYTYARNVIQWNLDIFNDGRLPDSGIRLRDDVTEGYNIIPNFFISAKMDNENFDYSDDGIEKTDRRNNKHKQKQFENRLFDRDTLLLFHYDVNFLFVLALYARNNVSQKTMWKEQIREKFRREIQEWLQEDYDFYAMRAHPGVNGEEYIRRNFKRVVGKMYTPFADETTYSLALDNKDTENNKELIAELSESFYVRRCALGQDPNEVLPETANIIKVEPKKDDLALCITKEGRHYDNAVALLKNTGRLGIALGMNGATLQLVEGFTTATYIIIHNKSNRYTTFYTDGKGPKLVSGNDIGDIVVTRKGAPIYLVYGVETGVHLHVGALDFSPITKGGDSYSPQLLPINRLEKRDSKSTQDPLP
ncbi:MAG: restriction endonuclease [Prevotella sp.]|nr:restriction endonuclease [Prevotella sp.]